MPHADFRRQQALLPEERIDRRRFAANDILFPRNAPPPLPGGEQCLEPSHGRTHQPGNHNVVHYAGIVLHQAQRRQVHLLVRIEGNQHRRDLRTDPGAVHPHGYAQRIQHSGRRSGFPAGQEVLLFDFRVFIRLQESVLQQEGMGAEHLAEQIGFGLFHHGKPLL